MAFSHNGSKLVASIHIPEICDFLSLLTAIGHHHCSCSFNIVCQYVVFSGSKKWFPGKMVVKNDVHRWPEGVHRPPPSSSSSETSSAPGRRKGAVAVHCLRQKGHWGLVIDLLLQPKAGEEKSEAGVQTLLGGGGEHEGGKYRVPLWDIVVVADYAAMMCPKR